MWIFTWSFLIKVFSLYQKHCFPGLKLTDFYLYGPDIILFLTTFQQIFLLRLNAINCAYCLSIMMHFRYAVKSNRTMVKREVTKFCFNLLLLLPFSQLFIMQSIDRSSECARKLKPSDILSHSYLVVCLFRKYKKEAFECQKWGKSFDILLEGRGKSITKWRKFLATFMGHIWSLWIARALTSYSLTLSLPRSHK